MIELPHPSGARLAGVEPIDLALAARLAHVLDHADDELLLHSLIATSEALREGHSCLLPAAWAGQCHWRDEDTDRPGYRFPALRPWLAHLSALNIDARAGQPLVLDRERLYLRRYWAFECELAAALRQRIDTPPRLDLAAARALLARLFTGGGNHIAQSLAVANALGRRFSVITGGPGTGKTHTVTQLLAALQGMAEGRLRIRMAAPTGKAAQRLNESVASARAALLEAGRIDPAIAAAIPDQATTLHRLLGVVPGTNDFRHHRRNPLRLDVLLLDEASMIDLPMMTRLLRALPDAAHLILVGDANQLPSIAVGSVLAELVAPRSPRHPAASEANRERLRALLGADTELERTIDPSTADFVTTLTHSHRFGGAIGRLADEVLQGEAMASWTRLNGDRKTIRHVAMPLDSWLAELAMRHYLPVAEADDIDQALKRLGDFRLLATTRVGTEGVVALNQRIETWLRRRLGVPPGRRHFHGLPIMVRENHPPTGLYNGDIGLIWENDAGRPMASFPRDGGAPRWIEPARLPACETVYAMTVHKTQGSEYRHVALLLPPRPNRLLSRELLYTAITRARQRLDIHASEGVWHAAVERRVERHSGLGERLFHGADRADGEMPSDSATLDRHPDERDSDDETHAGDDETNR